ncbi:N-acetylneuraminate synthase family protein [Desulfonatronum thioautotrophicum]|uniref:N-acetylneuraminate synthase family protein n=1 Tax=Desulfonatronum thioautotrophicum TaxID=617001 RepID=UPI0005EACB84|nr:N-acetylneuraminate synthase family protein [Desulfonatronum thioautotrophicum]
MLKSRANNQCLIIAEIGSVHDGSYGNAQKLIEAAAECGVDAVKFQTHIAEAETLPDAPMPSFFQSEHRFAYFQRTAFSLDQWVRLREHCQSCKVEFMSSPFSNEAVDLLESVGIARYKIPSGEVTNLPLLARVAQTGKPVLLSSGMSSWEELDVAVSEIRKVHENITILQCTSEYPCPYDQVGLNVMQEMKERYGLTVGLSDHTLTLYASFAAATLGAVAIERHFTFSRKMYGSDARHSLEPAELTDLVQGIRAIETMLKARVGKADASRFRDMKQVFEKSLVTKQDIPAGTVISRDMIGIKKPGTGIPAGRIDEVVGRRAVRSVKADMLLAWEDVQGVVGP